MGFRAREAQPEIASDMFGFRTSRAPDKRCSGVFRPSTSRARAPFGRSARLHRTAPVARGPPGLCVHVRPVRRVSGSGGSAHPQERRPSGCCRAAGGPDEVVAEGARRQRRAVEVHGHGGDRGRCGGTREAESLRAVPAGGVGEGRSRRTVRLDGSVRTELLTPRLEGDRATRAETPSCVGRRASPACCDVPRTGESSRQHPAVGVGRGPVPRRTVRAGAPGGCG